MLAFCGVHVDLALAKAGLAVVGGHLLGLEGAARLRVRQPGADDVVAHLGRQRRADAPGEPLAAAVPVEVLVRQPVGDPVRLAEVDGHGRVGLGDDGLGEELLEPGDAVAGACVEDEGAALLDELAELSHVPRDFWRVGLSEQHAEGGQVGLR